MKNLDLKDELKPVLKELKKVLIRQVGKQCKDRCRHCYMCIIWEAYNTLAEHDDMNHWKPYKANIKNTK